MSDQLSEEKVAEFRFAYRALAKDDVSPVINKDIGTLVRSLGFYPTEDEIARMIEEGDAEGMGWIDFEDFLTLMSKKLTQPVVMEEDIRACFRVFDKDSNGFISAAQLRQILTTMGEVLTDEEIDEMIKHADVSGDGHVNYEEFVTRMMDKTYINNA